jgi:WD40 repeat protein
MEAMPRPVVHPPLRNWQDFEDLCLDLWRRLWNDPDAQKNGRSGQPQAGVDIFGRPDGGPEWAGVQCKRFDEGSLTPKVVREEMAKARKFKPALSRYVIATTAPSDAHCQETARKITKRSSFPVMVVSWDEICHHLEQYPDLVKKYFGVPARATYPCKVARPDGFIPRQELDQLREILCGSGTPAVGITTALRGAGGFGKTTLAQALCHDERVRAAYPDGILWTTIGDQATKADRVSRILDLLRWWTDAEPPHFDSPRDAGDYLRKILGEQKVLMVIDDAWSPADVEPFRGAGAGLLVTTRMRETLPAGCHSVDVDAMQLNEAVKLLVAGLPGTEGLRPRFEDLARTLGEWPLLLKLVNGTLLRWVQRGLSIERALEEVAQARLEDFDRWDSTAREKAVSRTMEMSLRHLSGEERRRYEALAIFPEDENLPLRILDRLWECSSPAVREFSLFLYDLSLLRDLDLGAGTLRLHDVFRKYLIDRQGEAAAAVHREFLARSLPVSGNWADLPFSESYLWCWLPYHLVHAEQSENLHDLLLDIRFLIARLRTTDVNVVIGGFDHLPEDADLRTVQSTIRMSAHILVRHPEQLAGQLLGRLPEDSEQGRQAWERFRQQGDSSLLGGVGFLPRRASLTLAGGPLLQTFEGHTGGIYAVAALGEKQVLSGSSDGTLQLWDLATGTCLRSLQIYWVTALLGVGEGLVLAGSCKGMLCLWDLNTGTCLRTFEGHTDWICALAAVGEGRAVSCSVDGTLRLWDLATGACLRTLEGNRFHALAAAGEGRALSGSGDGTLRLWDLDTGACLCTFEGHAGCVNSVAIVEDGRALSGSDDRWLGLWDLATGACLRSFRGHNRRVRTVVAIEDGRALSGSDDGTIRLWELATGNCLSTIKGHLDGVYALATVGKGRAISASGDHTLRLWDLATEANLRAVGGRTRRVGVVVALAEGRALSGSRDGTLDIWDLATGTCLRNFKRHMGRISALTTCGGERVLGGLYNGTLHLWDLGTRACLQTFEGHTGGVFSVVAIGREQALSGSYDGTLRLWDLPTGTLLRSFKVIGQVLAVAMVGMEQALSVTLGSELCLWDLATGACLRTFEAQFDVIYALAVVGKGCVLSGSDLGRLRLWDLATGACLRTFEERTGRVTAVAAVGEGRALSADDCTLRLWDLATGACLAVFTFDDPVSTVAVEDCIVVVGDERGNVHFLDLILPLDTLLPAL